ncbi:MAG: SDR family oxidoreductase [Sphingobium sp.]
MDRVDGLKLVICGAAGGIGSAAVRGFADDGAKIVAFYKSTPPAEHLRDCALWVQCDLTDKAAVDAAFRDAQQHLGGLDAVIQAAGTWRGGRPESVNGDEIDFLLSVNLKTTIYTNQAAHECMKGAGGRIINFGSIDGISGNPSSALYAATRGAVHSWTRSAAKAWGKDGINVNTVSPAMHTDLVETLFNQFDDAGKAAFIATLAQRIPMGGKLGEPAQDLVPVLKFLAGPGSRYVTGQLIPVDGGMIMVGA